MYEVSLVGTKEVVEAYYCLFEESCYNLLLASDIPKVGKVVLPQEACPPAPVVTV